MIAKEEENKPIMLTTERRTAIFETMPVKKAVLTQIAPAIASQMIALVYNLADTYFVGLLNDPHQTAAITVVYPSFVMLTAISNLFGVGGASALARAMGTKETEKARHISVISLWGGVLSALLFSLLFWLAKSPLLTICGATYETYQLSLNYAYWVIIIGGPFTILSTLMANLIRAEGNAASASIGISLGGILNIILDPLFVLPSCLGLGATGAGIATAIANLASMLYFCTYLYHRRYTTVLSFQPRLLRYGKKYLKAVLAIGFPSALQYALTVVAVAAQARFVAQYPTEAVAALGIVKKLDQLPLYFSIGVANGLLPMLAYNYAAGNQQRRQEAFRLGCIVSIAFSLLCVIIYELFASQIASLFIADQTTIDYCAAFLRRMVTAMPLMAICYPMIIQFQAMGKAKESLVCSILRKGVLDIPLLFLMDTLLPLYGCMWVQPIVDAISLVICSAFYLRLRRKEQF